MASASCSISLSTVSPSSGNRRPHRRSSFKIQAQSYRSDEGRGRHIVDANLQVLRERIEEVRIRERLERCLESEFGWNYIPTHDYKRKNEVDISALLQLVCNVGGTIGFTILGCSFCLCLASIFIHLNH